MKRLVFPPANRLRAVLAAAILAGGGLARGEDFPAVWPSASPESQGMVSAKLDAIWSNLRQWDTTAFLVIRNDRVVYERYAPGYSRAKPHYTASMAKALVGGMTLMLAMDDGRIRPDDRASKFVPSWVSVPRKQDITIRELATHTSGMEDAESDGFPRLLHQDLTGWKGDFWKYPHGPGNPFAIARDLAPIVDPPGTAARYSNPGMAMLAYCVTASLRGAPQPDLRSLLKVRIMDRIGVPADEWAVGYGTTTSIDGLPLVANWGGADFSPNATARIGRLLLRKGDWEERQLISPTVVAAATRYAGMPNQSGLGWWVNRNPDGTRVWPGVPEDAFWGAGAQEQFLLVIPSLNLIVVRNGGTMQTASVRSASAAADPNQGHLASTAVLGRYIAAPVVQALARRAAPPYPPSPVMQGVEWAPKESILRGAEGSDVWAMAWADDGALYAAYGDGNGFKPYTTEKLSLGLARITGGPTDFKGINLRSATGEQMGDGRQGKKASGMLMVDGVLYMLVRNAGNSQLAWSSDHAKTWTWAGWKFTESFGCPDFLHFGRNYAGARDGYVYLYSPDTNSAYQLADRLVLARVPKARLRERGAYEFFVRLDHHGQPVWSHDIAERGAVFAYAGGCSRVRVTYDPALQRYLLTMAGRGGNGVDTRFAGGMGIYDAPQPWGPWTTAYFTDAWDVGPGESSSFPAKWLGADGRTAWLVFSGDDNFAVRKATFLLAPSAPAK